MPFMLVHHKVKDYAAWKPVFDEHAPARKNAGSKGGYVMQNPEDPNEVVIMFEVEDLQKAREFAASDDLRQAMERAGVSGPPQMHFLELADRSPA